ncbi:MAG: hypothetical protein GY853_01875 [PVC group bacterium]|nr:hypothetical protein [PVC group bacterium]
MIFYPSIGNKGYPYTDWRTNNWEFSCEFLEDVSERYKHICRILRIKYHWPPDIVDNIKIKRLLRIFEETMEDFTIKDPDTGEEKFMLD